jgi:hypothetical protein
MIGPDSVSQDYGFITDESVAGTADSLRRTSGGYQSPNRVDPVSRRWPISTAWAQPTSLNPWPSACTSRRK